MSSVVHTKKLKEYILKWSQILSLDSYKIDLHLSSGTKDADLESSFAYQITDPIYNNISIYVNKDITQEELDNCFVYGMEEVIVHELLHTWFAKVQNITDNEVQSDTLKKLADQEYDIIINKIAFVLVGLHSAQG